MTGLRVSVTGEESIVAGLKRLNPGLNDAILRPAMVEMALLVLRTAAQRHIKRGGRRGSKPVPKILTSRTGALRRSLSVGGGGLDKSRLPSEISAGSNLVYARVHEFGGRHTPKRPYLAPGLAESEDEFPAILLKHWARQL